MRKTMNAGQPDGSREPFTMYAVRLAGEDGWRVDVGAGNLNDISCRLDKEGMPVREILSIIRGWRPHGTSPADDRRKVRATAIARGWALDPQTGLWCGPRDRLREPPGSPESTEALDVTLGPPKAGRLPLRLRAGGQSENISVHARRYLASDLLTWIEGIVAGSCPRLALNEETRTLMLVAFPARGMLRLSTLHLQGEDAQWRFDVLTGKRALVGAFYRALRAFVDDTTTFEQEWLAYTNAPRRRPSTTPGSYWVFTEHFSLEDERFRQRPIESVAVEEFLRDKD